MPESAPQPAGRRAIAVVARDIAAQLPLDQALPGFVVDRVSSFDDEKISAGELVLLVAPERDFLRRNLCRIRSHPATALTPLIAVSQREGVQELQQLIDVFLPFPLDVGQLRQSLYKLMPLRRKIGGFSAPPPGLQQREELWLNLLRFLSSRGIFKLTPRWNINASQGYGYPVVSAILGAQPGEEVQQLELLTQMGLLEGRFYDKIHLCPQCQRFQLNFREVCPACRSSNLYLEENLHHYACGYIGPRRKFQQGGILCCPKCRQGLKSLGVDYDKPSSGHYCPNCQQSLAEALVDCLCLCCGASFSPGSARLQSIWEYQLTSLAWQAAQSGFVSQDKLRNFLHRQLGLLEYEIFKRLLEIEASISRRCPRPLCLIKLKIENYPYQNTGNAYLYQFWGRLMGTLRDNLRVNDLVTWLGGEEILILSVGASTAQAAQAVRRIQKSIALDWPQINLRSHFAALEPDQDWKLVLEELGAR